VSRSKVGLFAIASASLLSLFVLAPSLYALPPDRLSFPIGSPVAPERMDDRGFLSASALSGLEGVPVAGKAEKDYRVSDLGNRALVLCWHTFLGKEQFDTDFTLTEFAAQLDAIRALGYSFPTVDDFLAGRIRGGRNVIVTIDDGNHSIPAAIDKVLSPRGIVPTLFVYPAVLGTTDFSITDTELAALVARGIPAGAHGYHHLRVTEALYRESPKEFMQEIYKAKDRAEALSRSPILAYAYPYGALSPRTVAEVDKAGYAAGFAVGPGFVFANKDLDRLYELPRLVVLRSAWKDIYALLQRNAAEDGSATGGGQDSLPSNR